MLILVFNTFSFADATSGISLTISNDEIVYFYTDTNDRSLVSIDICNNLPWHYAQNLPYEGCRYKIFSTTAVKLKKLLLKIYQKESKFILADSKDNKPDINLLVDEKIGANKPNTTNSEINDKQWEGRLLKLLVEKYLPALDLEQDVIELVRKVPFRYRGVQVRSIVIEDFESLGIVEANDECSGNIYVYRGTLEQFKSGEVISRKFLSIYRGPARLGYRLRTIPRQFPKDAELWPGNCSVGSYFSYSTTKLNSYFKGLGIEFKKDSSFDANGLRYRYIQNEPDHNYHSGHTFAIGIFLSDGPSNEVVENIGSTYEESTCLDRLDPQVLSLFNDRLDTLKVIFEISKTAESVLEMAALKEKACKSAILSQDFVNSDSVIDSTNVLTNEILSYINKE